MLSILWSSVRWHEILYWCVWKQNPSSREPQDLSSHIEITALKDLLSSRGANTLPHTHARLFTSHVIGVADILRAWEQPQEVLLAGLFHSVYSTEMYPWGLYGFDERKALSQAIGTDAERVVWLYCTVSQNFVYTQVGHAHPAMSMCMCFYCIL